MSQSAQAPWLLESVIQSMVWRDPEELLLSSHSRLMSTWLMHGAGPLFEDEGQAWQTTDSPHCIISGQFECGKSTQILHGSQVIVVEVGVVVLDAVEVADVVDSVDVWMLLQ